MNSSSTRGRFLEASFRFLSIKSDTINGNEKLRTFRNGEKQRKPLRKPLRKSRRDLIRFIIVKNRSANAIDRDSMLNHYNSKTESDDIARRNIIQ